jgi:hypothetical protein
LTKPLLSKLNLLKILLLALPFSFSQYLGLCVFFFVYLEWMAKRIKILGLSNSKKLEKIKVGGGGGGW